MDRTVRNDNAGGPCTTTTCSAGLGLRVSRLALGTPNFGVDGFHAADRGQPGPYCTGASTPTGTGHRTT